MISSVAGKNGNPMMSAYSASKHAVEGLSEKPAPRIDAVRDPTSFIIAPGAVKTPIWSKAEEVDISALPELAFFPGAWKKIRKIHACISVKSDCPPEKIAERIADGP